MVARFAKFAGSGELTFVVPDAGHRLAGVRLQLEVRHADGSRECMTDPANPIRTWGAFGDKGVLEFPRYHQPDQADLPLSSEVPATCAATIAHHMPRFC